MKNLVLIMLLLAGCGEGDTYIIENPPGEPGPRGEDGTNGEQGPKGEDGTNGADGKDGTNGTFFSIAFPIIDECKQIYKEWYGMRITGNKLEVHDITDCSNKVVELKSDKPMFWPDPQENQIFIRSGDNANTQVKVVTLTEE